MDFLVSADAGHSALVRQLRDVLGAAGEAPAVREQIRDTARYDEVYLLKFLEARDFDMPRAAAQLRGELSPKASKDMSASDLSPKTSRDLGGLSPKASREAPRRSCAGEMMADRTLRIRSSSKILRLAA